MTLEQLRLLHPRLIYKQFFIEQSDQVVTMTHEFLLEPDIVFRPTVTIPHSGKIDEAFLRPYAFNLGLVEAISYWKAVCPREFVVEAGVLTDEQVRFWYDLFLHGLGEFFYRNEIDFTGEKFLEIKSKGHKGNWGDWGNTGSNKGDLVLVGGGKDSAVTLGIMKQAAVAAQTMVLNPTKAALETIRVSGLSDPIIVTRRIDPKLIELNAAGYLNGHTPFSAYLAFLGITVAVLTGLENVIVSNEKSANEGNVMYRGMEINHQYSKSFRFENLFREYIQTSGMNYFSFLRPLNDLQIGALFARYSDYFSTFRSCNVGSKTNTWCGACPKCAFTYLILFPFVSYDHMMHIFGRDYFREPNIIEHIRAMVGLTPVKPFECVGTRDETKHAVILSVEKCIVKGHEVPEELLKIKSDMGPAQPVLDQWGDTYNLPPEHLALLRSAYYGRNSG